MSSYFAAAYDPDTDCIRKAFFIDDHFGKHQYGVQFVADGKVYRPSEVEIPTDTEWVRPRTYSAAQRGEARAIDHSMHYHKAMLAILETQDWYDLTVKEAVAIGMKAGKGNLPPHVIEERFRQWVTDAGLLVREEGVQED